jgi:trans-aconitate methyltransferase
VGQYHFDPETYLELIAREVPAYVELQERVADATVGVEARRVLDLGAGTGETTRRVLARHPAASLVAVDASEAMLARLDVTAEQVVARLQDPLPPGPFDLVVSALAVHHLDAAEKRGLFARVRDALRPGGRFVLGDVVVVERTVAPLTDGYDKPDTATDQLAWLRAAGFEAEIAWERDDLALLVGDRP